MVNFSSVEKNPQPVAELQVELRRDGFQHMENFHKKKTKAKLIVENERRQRTPGSQIANESLGSWQLAEQRSQVRRRDRKTNESRVVVVNDETSIDPHTQLSRIGVEERKNPYSVSRATKMKEIASKYIDTKSLCRLNSVHSKMYLKLRLWLRSESDEAGIYQTRPILLRTSILQLIESFAILPTPRLHLLMMHCRHGQPLQPKTPSSELLQTLRAAHNPPRRFSNKQHD